MLLMKRKEAFAEMEKIQERLDAIKKNVARRGRPDQFLAANKIEFKAIKRTISQRLTPSSASMTKTSESEIADVDIRSF